MIILLLFLLLINVYSYEICIVGADSTLGRELVYQSLKDKKYHTLALTGKNYLTGKNKIIYEPSKYSNFRGNYLNPIFDEKLTIENYWCNITQDYEHLIFCIDKYSLEYDYSDILMKKILINLSNKCKSITLINDFFIRDCKSRENTDKILNSYKKKIKKNIHKPKGLYNKYKLSKDILENL